ncbi:hypothetical protein [Pseudoxanthomonas sp. J35]|uniref:hypothetical protein n=1 Tax=Pseudoxanthomonas sp. J35 TaxID=935852 RepID=UPI0004B6736C|nr:hypothetical protein [Pseudoxanthomonas sp. J35]
MKQHRTAGSSRALALGIAAGVASGAVAGIALDNLDLGTGPGIATGIAMALALTPRKDGGNAPSGNGEARDGT